jgi:hypothetical protein
MKQETHMVPKFWLPVQLKRNQNIFEKQLIQEMHKINMMHIVVPQSENVLKNKQTKDSQ